MTQLLSLLALLLSHETATSSTAQEPSLSPPKENQVPDTPFEHAVASDFVDTRITFAFSNINMLARPGERLYQSSGYRIGVDPNFNLFLENVDTRFSAYETLSQLVLYKKFPGFFERWETEAAIAARLTASTDTGQVSLYDAGTYLRVIYKLAEGAEQTTGAFDLTAWPVSSDRFRLGYTYLISWGGTTIFPGKLVSRVSEGAVPGFRLRWRSPNGASYAFLGMKSALILSRESNQRAGEQVPQYGFLGGGGTTLADYLLVETNGGYFQKGSSEATGLEGRAIHAWGVSARVTAYDGIAPSLSADYKLLRNDPHSPEDYLLYKPWRAGSGYSLAVEGNFLGQNLADPDRFASERMVYATAFGLVGQAKWDTFALRIDAFFQSPDFILFDVPGFVPFQATFKDARTTPEFFTAATVQVDLDAYKLRPSLALGLKIPATYLGVVPVEQGSSVGGAKPGDLRRQILADNRNRVVLPPGTDATPILGAVLKVPFFLSMATSIAAEMRAELNDNQARTQQDNEIGHVTYFFDEPLRLSVAAVLQSRF